jgi:C-terminal processing protease CtpA/Prc
VISSPPGDEEAGRPRTAPERRGRPPVDGVSVPRRRRSGLLTVLAVVVACYATGLAVNNLAVLARTAPIIDTVFPQIGRGDRLDLASIAAAWDVVRREYVYRDVDPAAATLSSERGIVDYLHNTARFADRFSAFYTKAQYQELQQSLSGERAGSIGIALEARCSGATLCPPQATPTVVAIEDVLRGQPAEAAGLRNGDILLAVDGHAVASLGGDVSSRIDRAAHLIRGPAGTQVSLTVARGGATLTVVVTRRDLHIPSVYSQRFGTFLYLQVTGFDEGTGAALHDRLRQGARRRPRPPRQSGWTGERGPGGG